MKAIVCWTALSFWLKWTAPSETAELQGISIALDIVTSVHGNGGKRYHYSELFSPRKNVFVKTFYNWSIIDPRDPFLSIRHVSEYSGNCIADLSIWNVDWELADILIASSDLPTRRTLLWYGGVSREVERGEVFTHLMGNYSADCFTGPIQYPELPASEISLSSDFQALEKSYLEAMETLLKTVDWRRMVLVTDNITARHINRVLTIATEGRHKVTQLLVLDGPQEDHIHEGIRESYYSGMSSKINFLVFCEINCVEKILAEAQRFDMKMGGKTALSYMSRWLVVLLPIHREKIERLLTDLNNVAIVIPASAAESHINTEQMRSLMRDAIFEVFTSSNFSQFYPDVQRNKDVYMDSTLASLIRNIRNQDRSQPCPSCSVFEVHTALWKTTGRKFSQVGSFNVNSGLKINHDGIFPNINFGFNNQTLRVATLPWPLFVIVNEETGGYQGLCMDLLLEMSRKLNFSYVIYEPADGEWGVTKPDGHWTGLVGELEFARANLTVAPVAITADREQVADFAFPFYYDYNGVLIKKPDPRKLKWRTLVDIFTYPVYIGILVSLPVMTSLLYVCEKHNPYYPYYFHGRRRLSYPGLHNFQDAFWYLYGALLTQGGLYLPRSQTGRTLLSFWWLYCIIMVATYSGNLIASLTVTTDRLPFNTLKDMLKQDEYKWGTTSGTYLSVLFQGSNLSEYKQIWQGIQEFKSEIDAFSDSHAKHINMVKQGSYAYLNDKSGMAKWVSEECDLVLIKEEFFPMTYAIGLPRDSPYKDIISQQMLKIVESGLMHIWKQKWWPKQNFCSGLVKTVAKSIELEDVQSAFYLLCIGAILGFGAVIAETIRNHLHKSNLKNRQQSSGPAPLSTVSYPVLITHPSS